MRKLYERDATAMDMLLKAAAVWLFFERRSHHLGDQDELTLTLGHQILLAKKRRVHAINKTALSGIVPSVLSAS